MERMTCSLEGRQIAGRLDQFAALGRDGVLSIEPPVVRFRPDASIRARIEALIAAEAECCSFLDLSLADEGESLALTIAAPPGADPLVVPAMIAALGRDR